jgi:formate hydrogenlyase subunit 4
MNAIIQILGLVILSPLASGLIRCVKNTARRRRGQPLLQPYFNLAKLFKKEEVVSGTASWIFTVTPYIVLAATLTAAGIIPLFKQSDFAADLFALIFIFALGRFFLSLAGLDTASSFGGMGSSREMFISALCEPALFLSVFVFCLNSGSTAFIGAAAPAAAGIKASVLICGFAFFLILLAETGRIPVDNQETHLELTMIHEAMVLEYSGRSLALLELAGHIKQMVLFALMALVIPPYADSLAILGLKIIAISVTVALVEVSIAKMRLFRAVDYITFAFIAGLSGLAAFLIGW